MQPSVSNAWRAFNQPLEGLTSWMYLDVKGLVTTGMGNLIDPVQMASALPWLDAAGAPAVPAAVDAEWHRIKANLALAHQGAEAARRLTTLHLADPTIDQLIQDKLALNEAILIQNPAFSNFRNWPADAQLGLLSMAWAMGAGFGPGFPHFSQACAAGDFSTAAADCEIGSVGNPGVIRRNAANRQAFLFAGNATAHANPGVLQSAVPPH